VSGAADAIASVRGPIIYIANLLTEGRGMNGFTAADAVARLSAAIGRPIDVVVFNSALPAPAVLEGYALEHKVPLELGTLPEGCQLIEGAFWRRSIARHHRSRLRTAVWAALADHLLIRPAARHNVVSVAADAGT
jgi:hypothetical protein